MLLGSFLNAMDSQRIVVRDGLRCLTLRELRQIHQAHLNSPVVRHHVHGLPNHEEVRTAGLGLYLFSVRHRREG